MKRSVSFHAVLRGSLVAAAALVLLAPASIGCSDADTIESSTQAAADPTDPNGATETNVMPVPCSKDEDCGDAGLACLPNDAEPDAGVCETAPP